MKISSLCSVRYSNMKLKANKSLAWSGEKTKVVEFAVSKAEEHLEPEGKFAVGGERLASCKYHLV